MQGRVGNRNYRQIVNGKLHDSRVTVPLPCYDVLSTLHLPPSCRPYVGISEIAVGFC